VEVISCVCHQQDERLPAHRSFVTLSWFLSSVSQHLLIVALDAVTQQSGGVTLALVLTAPHKITRATRPGAPTFAFHVSPFMRPLRQLHGRYLPVLQAMAKLWVAAKAEFAWNPDERSAGRKAAVLTAVIGTQRTMTEEDLRRIVL
jgi:hypothetical protein